MKMIFTLSLILASTSTVYAANDLQEIDCRFPNPESKDHVLVTLENAQKGFFTYTTGVEDTGEAQNTGKLLLYRIEDSKKEKDYAQFSAKMKTIEDGGEIIVDFIFSLPKNLIFKNSTSFKAGFHTTITDMVMSPLRANDELICKSHLN